MIDLHNSHNDNHGNAFQVFLLNKRILGILSSRKEHSNIQTSTCYILAIQRILRSTINK